MKSHRGNLSILAIRFSKLDILLFIAFTKDLLSSIYHILRHFSRDLNMTFPQYVIAVSII